MSQIDNLFKQLRLEKRKALMPFIPAGDPDLAFTEAILRQAVRSGASLCEVGIPYSDPIADGPVIQSSYTRALAGKVTLQGILTMLKRVAPELGAPLATMVSYATIYRHGLASFVEKAQAAGVSGAIVPDLPVDEAEPLLTICRAADFNLIQLVTPTTPVARALRIAETSTGFLYYVSVTGITGQRNTLPAELLENVAWLREQTSLPICIGFGISQAEHIRTLAPVADGLIVGSALVQRFAGAERDRETALAEAGKFLAELHEAIQGVPQEAEDHH